MAVRTRKKKKEDHIGQARREIRESSGRGRGVSWFRLTVVTYSPLCGANPCDGWVARQHVLEEGHGSLSRTDGQFCLVTTPPKPDWDKLTPDRLNHEIKRHLRPFRWADVVEFHLFGVEFELPKQYRTGALAS